MRSLATFSFFIWILFPLLLLLSGCFAVNTTNTAISSNSPNLLEAFREHYQQFQSVLVSVHNEETDVFLLELLTQDLQEFNTLVNQVNCFYHLMISMNLIGL